MKPERWKQVDALFDAVLELPSEERVKFLNESCDGDEELRREVLSLLAAHEKADGFMASPAMELAAKNIAQENTIVEMTGREIGEYKVERLLGTGGMGEVYLAQHTKLNRKVALKILPAQFLKDADRVKRFEREARAVSSLNHPNLITIYDIGNSNGLHFIATEYVEGKTVRELIEKKISMKEALSIAMQVAEALNAAHSEKIIHRDIKPENLMVRPDGYVKVLDFGLAKLVEPTDGEMNSSFSQTQPGVIMGTLSYMSPEQATGEGVDHRTDIWSLGIVLYEMVTGVAPFKGANRQETLNAILSKEPTTVMESNPAIHPELDHIIYKALEKDCELRYQTTSDFRADLKRLRRELDSGSITQSVSGRSAFAGKPTTSSPARQMPWPFILIGVLAVCVVATSIWLLLRLRSNTNPFVKATFTKLTSQGGEELWPGISPDGKDFVYSSRAAGNSDIYTQRVGAQNERNLTADSPLNEIQPAFSHNGKRIAFGVDNGTGGIYVMGETGESRRQLTDFGFTPAWSADDKEIVFSNERLTGGPFSRTTNPGELWIVTVETGARRKINVEDGAQPNWSPHGDRIAFWALENGGQRDIWTIPAAGGTPVRVTNDAAADWNPVWSADGKYLFFGSDRGGSMNFWRVPINEQTGKTSGEPQPVTAPATFAGHLSICGDGKHFVYVQTVSTSNLQTLNFDPEKELVTSEPTSITQGSRMIEGANLSPDGERFVYNAREDNQEDIFIIKRDGTGQNQLTEDAAKDRGVRWSPDGSKITFFSDRSGKYEAWSINADANGLEQITFTDGTSVLYPFWSRDGAHYVYSRWQANSSYIDGTKPWKEQTPQIFPQIPFPKGYFWAYDWSPDGKFVAGRHALTGNGGIMIYDVEKQSYDKLTDYGESPYWLNDNRRLVFSSRDRLFMVDSRTKKAKEIYSHKPYNIPNFGLSRDNRLLYFTLVSVESDVWLMTIE